jgi:hypothetical protein
MSVITSQFQGVLPVPLFQVPYTYNVPGYYPAPNWGASFNAWSDTPLVRELYTVNLNGNNNVPYYSSGEATALRYDHLNTWTMNGGFQAAFGAASQSKRAAYYGAMLTYGFNWYTAQPGNLTNSYTGLSQTGFYGNGGVIQNMQPPIDIVGNNSDWLPLNAVPVTSAYGGAFSCLPCVIGGPLGVYGGDFVARLRGYLFLLGNGTPELVANIPGFMFVNGPYVAPATGYSITNFEICANLPDTRRNVNYLFGFGTNAQISRLTWQIQTYTVNTLNIAASDTLVFDNNSNLNAQLTKYNSQTICAPIGLRGFLATDIDANIDYFVSLDGSKYWRLQYVPQGSAVAPSAPSAAEQAYKFVDTNGVFWYTGNSAVSGSTVQPLYSFGKNIPFAFPTLPPVSPLALPCWADCLGIGDARARI